MTDQLTDEDKTVLRDLVAKIDNAKGVFDKIVRLLKADNKPSKYIRALIQTLVGFVATATAIAAAVLSRSHSNDLLQAVGGDLLTRAAWIILTSMICILLLQIIRFYLDRLEWKIQFLAMVLSIVLIIVPTIVVVWTVKAGVCGGEALAMPPAHTADTAQGQKAVPVLDGRLLGFRMFDCSDEAARWFSR